MKHLLPAVLLAVAACGGTPETAKKPGGGSGSGSAPAAPGVSDVAFDLGPYELKGTMFEPEALERPGMMLSPPKKKTTIDKLRDTVAKTKDVETRQALAIGLATMLYEDGKANKGNADKDVQEARQALTDAVAAAGDKVDDLTLKFLGVYELYPPADYAAAEKAYAALLAKAPADKDIATSRAWLALAQLKQYKNADAKATVADQAPSDKNPELAYVTAWAKWRTGDDAGAWQAIVAAAKGWSAKELANHGAVDRDVMLFAARTNTSLADAMPQLAAIFGKDKTKTYETLAKLGLQAYGFAGRWADGIAAIDKALASGANIPLNDVPTLRYTQADFAVRLDSPDVAAAFAKQALDALPACGSKCTDKDKADVVEGVYVMGRLFHLYYATANDGRYYQPAHDLYTATAPLIMDTKVRTDALKEGQALEATQIATQKAAAHVPPLRSGTHDKQAIGALIQRHAQEVVACYEQQLAGNPKLAGTIVANLEVAQNGEVKGVSTDPKAGLADQSAVAGCIADHAKAWKLLQRGIPGTTRIKLIYSLGPKK